VLSGHATSLALEPEFWAVLEALAGARGCSLAALVAEIDAGRGDHDQPKAAPDPGHDRLFALGVGVGFADIGPHVVAVAHPLPFQADAPGASQARSSLLIAGANQPWRGGWPLCPGCAGETCSGREMPPAMWTIASTTKATTMAAVWVPPHSRPRGNVVGRVGL